MLFVLKLKHFYLATADGDPGILKRPNPVR